MCYHIKPFYSSGPDINAATSKPGGHRCYFYINVDPGVNSHPTPSEGKLDDWRLMTLTAVVYLTELSMCPLLGLCGVLGTLCAPLLPSQFDTHPVRPWCSSASNIYTQQGAKVQKWRPGALKPSVEVESTSQGDKINNWTGFEKDNVVSQTAYFHCFINCFFPFQSDVSLLEKSETGICFISGFIIPCHSCSFISWQNWAWAQCAVEASQPEWRLCTAVMKPALKKDNWCCDILGFSRQELRGK